MSRSRLGLSAEPRFHEELIELPREAQKKVIRAITELCDDPSRNSKPLQGEDGIWRREIAPYRVLFTIGDGWVHVHSVQHRQGVYKGRIARPTHLPMSSLTRTSDVALPDWEAPAIATDIVLKAIGAESADELLDLVDLGLPEPIFDRMLAFLEQRDAKGDAKAKGLQISLVRTKVIESFFGSVIGLPSWSTLQETIIVSPWITPWRSPRSSLSAVATFLKGRRPPTTVVTRPPQTQRHQEAISAFAAIPNTEILFNESLHAKFFVADVGPIPIALVGSANATQGSLGNLELGVFVRGSGEAETFVRDLQALSIDLRAVSDIYKRRGTVL